MRENRTPGSVQGRSGNWPFYCDEQRQLMTFLDQLMADRRLPRLRQSLTEPVASLRLPERATPPPRPALPLAIA